MSWCGDPRTQGIGASSTNAYSQGTVRKLSYPAPMPQQTPRTAQRDQGLARAAQLRTACAVGAVVVTAVLGYLAAGSVPGRASTSNSAVSTSSDTGVSSQSGLQPPQQPPVSGGGGGGQNLNVPIVSSGGS